MLAVAAQQTIMGTGLPHNVIHARLNAGRPSKEALFIRHLPSRWRARVV